MKLFLEFTDKKEELLPALLKVCSAIDGMCVNTQLHCFNNCFLLEILRSESLQKIFYTILVAGNFINSVSTCLHSHALLALLGTTTGKSFR